MWTISLPLRVPVSKKKFFTLNLNQYRNTHYQTLNRAKTLFQDIALEQIRKLPMLGRCSLEYVLYPRNRQLCDVSNVCSVVDKFFADALVSSHRLDDDNYKVVPFVAYRFGAIDRENPRVDVIIRPLGPDNPVLRSLGEMELCLLPSEPLTPEPEKELNMQIKTVVTLPAKNIEEALRAYLKPHVTIPEGSTLELVSKGDTLEIHIASGLDLSQPEPIESEKEEIKDAPAPKTASKPRLVQKAAAEPQEATKEASAPAPLQTKRSGGTKLFGNLTKPTNA